MVCWKVGRMQILSSKGLAQIFRGSMILKYIKNTNKFLYITLSYIKINKL